ncbi:MAG: hypothetical protein J3K34DRAFT_404138 [Monoraphidium minutum]|nr:MAG: hypothetical protein J3K34DRAFT_404138 [Monoraphidium minutum]
MHAQVLQKATRPTTRRAAPRSCPAAPLRPVGTRGRRAAACEALAGLRAAQLLAGATPALLRASHVCGSIKQQLGDAIDELDGQKGKRMAAINKLYHAKVEQRVWGAWAWRGATMRAPMRMHTRCSGSAARRFPRPTGHYPARLKRPADDSASRTNPTPKP